MLLEMLGLFALASIAKVPEPNEGWEEYNRKCREAERKEEEEKAKKKEIKGQCRE